MENLGLPNHIKYHTNTLVFSIRLKGFSERCIPAVSLDSCRAFSQLPNLLNYCFYHPPKHTRKHTLFGCHNRDVAQRNPDRHKRGLWPRAVAITETLMSLTRWRKNLQTLIFCPQRVLLPLVLWELHGREERRSSLWNKQPWPSSHPPPAVKHTVI